MNVIFIWDLSLHPKVFFLSIGVRVTVSSNNSGWVKKSFWEIDAAGQSDLCETVPKPSGSQGVAHVVFLQIYLLRFPLLPRFLLCPSERAVSSTLMELPWAHLFTLLCYGWGRTSNGSPKSHGETVRECWELQSSGNPKPSRRLGEDGLLPDARLGQKPASPLLTA